MSNAQEAWRKLVAAKEPLEDMTDRQRITAKLAENERIARAMVIVDAQSQIVKPDHVEARIIKMLEHVREELLILSEMIR